MDSYGRVYSLPPIYSTRRECRIDMGMCMSVCVCAFANVINYSVHLAHLTYNSDGSDGGGGGGAAATAPDITFT